MADNRWLGGTGVYDTTSNWSLGAKPADTNSCFIPRTVSQDIETGMDDETGIDLAAWVHEKNCTVNVGNASAYAHLAAALLQHEGSGTIYWDNDDDTGSAATDLVICNSDNKVLALSLKGSNHANGDYGDIFVHKGVVELVNGRMVANKSIKVGYRDNPGDDAVLRVLSGFTAPALIEQSAGRVTSAANVTTARVCGGTYEQTGATTLTTLDGHGGTILWNTTGTLTTANLLRGVFDMTRSAGTKTVTSLWLWPGATLIRNDNHHTITNLYRRGGREILVA